MGFFGMGGGEGEGFSYLCLQLSYSCLLHQVRVTKGFFGERGEDSVIPVDEVYNLYFVKKAKVSQTLLA